MNTNTKPINSQELYFNKLISKSIEEKSKYYALKKRYQAIVGFSLIFLSFLLISILVFFSNDLAIQQALIAIAIILIIAGLKTFQDIGNLSEDKEIKSFDLPINLDKIIFDSRTIIEGDYHKVQNTDYYSNDVANYTTNQKQNLAEAASEIQTLLEQLSLKHPTQTAQEKITIAAELIDEIDNSPTLRKKVISAFKAGGISVLRESIPHPLATIALATIEGWQESENKALQSKDVPEDDRKISIKSGNYSENISGDYYAAEDEISQKDT